MTYYLFPRAFMNHIIYPKQSEFMLTVDCTSEILVWHLCVVKLGSYLRWGGFSYRVVEDRGISICAFKKLIDIRNQRKD